MSSEGSSDGSRSTVDSDAQDKVWAREVGEGGGEEAADGCVRWMP
jgi:hypothetical protein